MSTFCGTRRNMALLPVSHSRAQGKVDPVDLVAEALAAACRTFER